jgi:ABC-type amino acid transport substrate-binding protein
MHIRSTLVAVAAAATMLVMAVAAAAAVKPPPSIASAGKIVCCTDATYPPEEYFKGSNIVGSDIDIGAGVAKLMGVKAQFKNTTFDSIIPALLVKKCDAIIAGMNDTAKRRKQVDFVDYLNVGQAVTVKKGNPEHFTTLAASTTPSPRASSPRSRRTCSAAAASRPGRRHAPPPSTTSRSSTTRSDSHSTPDHLSPVEYEKTKDRETEKAA